MVVIVADYGLFGLGLLIGVPIGLLIDRLLIDPLAHRLARHRER